MGILPAVEVDHPRAASLAPARRSKPQFPDAASPRDFLASQRILGQMLDQGASLVPSEQLVGLANEGWGLGDRLHSAIYNPMGYSWQAGRMLPGLRIVCPSDNVSALNPIPFAIRPAAFSAAVCRAASSRRVDCSRSQPPIPK